MLSRRLNDRVDRDHSYRFNSDAKKFWRIHPIYFGDGRTNELLPNLSTWETGMVETIAWSRIALLVGGVGVVGFLAAAVVAIVVLKMSRDTK